MAFERTCGYRLNSFKRCPGDGGEDAATRIGGGGEQGTLYTYSGRFWDVPQTFAFPGSVKRDVGWRLWLQGMPAHTTVGENGEMIQNKIKAFRKFLPARLPRKLAEDYKLHWRPLFSMMEKGFGDIPDLLTPAIVNNLYDLGTEYLRTRVSYVFTNEKLHHNAWVIATWAKYLSRSMIMKKGTDDDKQNLPAATYLNRPRAAGLKRRRGANAGAIRQDQPAERQRRRGPHTAIEEEVVGVTPHENDDSSDNND
jgi:hypothetical protein